jgi:hypothetical protein
MVEQDSSVMTPDEAGAFVAQWVQHRKIGVLELDEKLGVDETQVPSLVRQAKGRMSMERWLVEKQPQSLAMKKGWIPVLLALFIGTALGCFLMSTFFSNTPQAQAGADASHPKIEVTTSDPPPVLHSDRKDDTSTHPRFTLPPMDGGLHTVADPHFSANLKGWETQAALAPKAVPVSPQFAAAQRNTVDVTQWVGSRIPRDLIIQMVTPNGIFEMRGVISKDYRFAQRLATRDLVAPLEAMLRFMSNQRIATSTTVEHSNGQPALQVNLHLGWARSQASIAISSDQKMNLVKLVEGPNSELAKHLCNPLLGQIHAYGLMLFAAHGSIRRGVMGVP